MRPRFLLAVTVTMAILNLTCFLSPQRAPYFAATLWAEFPIGRLPATDPLGAQSDYFWIDDPPGICALMNREKRDCYTGGSFGIETGG